MLSTKLVYKQLQGLQNSCKILLKNMNKNHKIKLKGVYPLHKANRLNKLTE